jgi:lysophospholipase L1-like esterase
MAAGDGNLLPVNILTPRYFKERCDGAIPDVITIFLGINDCFTLADSLDNLDKVDKGFDRVLANADVFVDALQKAAPDAIIGICITPPANTRDEAFKANYKDRWTRWGWRQVQHLWTKRQIAHFGNRQQNGVHPNAKGYKQLATSIFSWMKWLLHKDVIAK